jgi:hypothetical protein
MHCVRVQHAPCAGSLAVVLLTFHMMMFSVMQLGERLAAQVADRAARSELAERQVRSSRYCIKSTS